MNFGQQMALETATFSKTGIFWQILLYVIFMLNFKSSKARVSVNLISRNLRITLGNGSKKIYNIIISVHPTTTTKFSKNHFKLIVNRWPFKMTNETSTAIQ